MRCQNQCDANIVNRWGDWDDIIVKTTKPKTKKAQDPNWKTRDHDIIWDHDMIWQKYWLTRDHMIWYDWKVQNQNCMKSSRVRYWPRQEDKRPKLRGSRVRQDPDWKTKNQLWNAQVLDLKIKTPYGRFKSNSDQDWKAKDQACLRLSGTVFELFYNLHLKYLWNNTWLVRFNKTKGQNISS